MPVRNLDTTEKQPSGVELDLYFLIARFLSQGPCQEAGKVLVKELEKYGLLHKSLDWTGRARFQNFSDSVSRFRDIAPDHLLQICNRVIPLFNQTLPPPLPGQNSLCSLGRHSLLRNENVVAKSRWNSRSYSACIGRAPLVPASNFAPGQNWTYGIFGRENGGARFRNLLRPIKTLYGRMKLHRRILGHLSAVYCILFDRTGTRIFTGSDDCLIKCWSVNRGRLLATFRGHQSEICDMDVSFENNLLASASCDKEIRIWDTRNGKPVTILQSHSAMITSIEFSAMVQGDMRYLVSTGRDGNVIFWTWNVCTLEFDPRPHKFQERNRPGVAMLCSSCSAGGRFVAVGGSDNLVHIYHMPFEHNSTAIGPLTIAEQDEHSNTVDSIWFSNSGFRLISGSKDGTARIWSYEYATWNSLVLEVSRTHGSPLDTPRDVPNTNEPSTSKNSQKSQGKDASNKICVIMVAWDCRDENVFTSLTNYTIKVWNSTSRDLISILKGHTDEAYCLEPHPNDNRILLTAGHDGNVFLWDVTTGSILMNFHNMLEGLGHGAVFDAKFSRDGNSFACTDSHGHLLVFGFGDGKAYHKSPVHQFFHTDYRPLIRDQHGYVLDEQTQQAPHLMPPPFLVDMDGNPYPPDLQRLVPGRERSNDSQLLPNLVVQENDAVEVFDVDNIPENPIPEPPRSALDDRIQEMLHQDGEAENPIENGLEPPPFASPSSVGLRREGDTAGVRQMHPNAPRSQVASMADIMALTQRVITTQFTAEEQKHMTYMRKKKGQIELICYRRENKKRRPVSHRRLSRDGTKQYKAEQVSKHRVRSCIRFKEDPEDEEEETADRRSIRRKIKRMRTYAHGYSTRSMAPRSRMPSVLESSLEENFEEIVLEEEEMEAESGDTESLESSDEEDFSQKAKILRRSKRRQRENGDARHHEIRNSAQYSDDEMEGLRRSKRQRRIPKRLEDTSGDEDSSFSDEETPRSDANSLFSPPATRKSKLKKGVKPRKKRTQRIYSNASNNLDTESDTNEQSNSLNLTEPSTSRCQYDVKVQLRNCTTSKHEKIFSKESKNKLPAPIQIPYPIKPGELPPDVYLPTDWVKRVTPCNFPYMPQLDDEIMYLRQGHEMYIMKVQNEQIWSVDESELCYKKFPEIGVAELCRVNRIDYIIGPPTLCEISLTPINRKVSKKSMGFSVKYHDMPNVVDFLILKDKYDTSIGRNWTNGDRFRSIIDDTWWFGTVVEHKPHNLEFPDSHFQSFSILWDSDTGQGDLDFLSPWDMEPLPNAVVTRSHNSTSSSSVHSRIDLKEMRQIISYKTKVTDWRTSNDSDSEDERDDSDEDRNLEHKSASECERISNGIREIIEMSKYSAFVSPVDMRAYPSYAFYVAYPTDLSTILQRLENRFYRRSAAICWEIKQLEKNALAFNEPGSLISKMAEFLSEIFVEFIKNSRHKNISRLHDEMIAERRKKADSDEAESSYEENESDVEQKAVLSSEEDVETEGESGKSGRESQNVSEYASTAGEDEDSNPAWIVDCQNLLTNAMQMRDSRPFRLRVKDDDEEELEQEEDEEILDLLAIEGKLTNSIYKNPVEFKNDVFTMFQAFKNSNPSREDKTMMTKFSPFMMLKVDDIISNHENVKSTKLNERNLRRSLRTRTRSLKYGSSNGDWCVTSTRRSARIQSVTESSIMAYPTRRMLRRHRIDTGSVSDDQQLDYSERRSRSSRLRKVKDHDSENEDVMQSENEERPSRLSRSRKVKDEYSENEDAVQSENDERLSRSSRSQKVNVENSVSEDAVQSENDEPPSGSSRSEKVKVDYSENMEESNDENKILVEITENGESTSKKRRISESENDQGQGDASLSLRLRKRPKLGKKSENSSDEEYGIVHDSDDDTSNSKLRAKRKTNGVSYKKDDRELRTHRQRPTRFSNVSDASDSDYEHNGTEKPRSLRNKSTYARPKYNESNEDSESDGILETDDLEGEFPPLSPEGHLLPKKSRRFRNPFQTDESFT